MSDSDASWTSIDSATQTIYRTGFDHVLATFDIHNREDTSATVTFDSKLGDVVVEPNSTMTVTDDVVSGFTRVTVKGKVRIRCVNVLQQIEWPRKW